MAAPHPVGVWIDPADSGSGREPDSADLTPSLRVEPARGQAMITRFDCGSLGKMLLVQLLHWRVKRDVRRNARGYLGIVLLRDWRHRTVLSISLWKDLRSVYSMGEVPAHISVTRVPAKLGIATSCGVFCYSGDWREVMFGGGPQRSPLEPWRAVNPPAGDLPVGEPSVTHVRAAGPAADNPTGATSGRHTEVPGDLQEAP
ncbi:hypothetical protein AB0M46_33430 [Dactylosporangium sp. NPDC051485]|uniref:hypothetical protein n=1 Tax=Dactylosporangium sp. NPDC051485 TaxID=3154846 RepID=UPI0034480F2E